MKLHPGASPISELCRWHKSHDLDRSAPPWLVQRANDQHTAGLAAHRLLSLEAEYAVGLVQSARDEIAGGMVSHAERCASNTLLAPCLARIGHESDAEKVLNCRTCGRLMRRESDGQIIPLPDSKCRRPRVCPHCARDEAARLRRRYTKRLHALARTHSLYFFTVSPVQVPADRLEYAWRALFAEFDALRRTRAGGNIKAALTSVENTVSGPGLHHPHLHAIVAASGAVSWKAWRSEINRLLRARFAPVIAGDVYYRPKTDDFVRIEAVRCVPGAVRKEFHGAKRRLVCDFAHDVALLSDGASFEVSEVLEAIEHGELVHGYGLRRPLTGARARVVALRHAPGRERARDILVLEKGDGHGGVTREERTLGELRGEFSRGELVRDPHPMSFQIDFQPVGGDTSAIDHSLRELLKYLVKPGDLHTMDDDDLRAVMDAGGRRFRRTRAYGVLHGGKTDTPRDPGVEMLKPVGLFRYDGTRRDVELQMGGKTTWAREMMAQAQVRREAERDGRKDLIPPDKSAVVNKALKSAYGDRPVAAQCGGTSGFYHETGPPAR